MGACQEFSDGFVETALIIMSHDVLTCRVFVTLVDHSVSYIMFRI